MDWSSIVAGGVTGLLSGAISGNLVQYVLDRRRTRDQNRHQLLDEWDRLLNDDESTYERIVSYPSYVLLTSFISPKSRRFLAKLLTETNAKRQKLESAIEAYYEFYDDELMALDYNPDRYEVERTHDIHEGASHWRTEVSLLKKKTTQELVACLKRELLRLKKRWGISRDLLTVPCVVSWTLTGRKVGRQTRK